MTATLHFTNNVNEAGYVWEFVDHFAQRIPPWNSEPSQEFALRFADSNTFVKRNSRVACPTADDSALFRNFAGLDPTAERMLEFANQYGPLDAYELEGIAQWPGGEEDLLNWWEYHIRTMRFVIDIWDDVSAKRTKKLAEHFVRDASGHFVLPHRDSLLLYFLRSEADQKLYPKVWGESILDAAKQYVLLAINGRLDKHHAELAIRSVKSHLQLTLRPRNLIGAIWLQFAESISVDKKYRQCEACGRHMEISPSVNRTDRRYCSDACRNRALRQRQKVAKEMRKVGKGLRDIAKQTGSDVGTVKKWLS